MGKYIIGFEESLCSVLSLHLKAIINRLNVYLIKFNLIIILIKGPFFNIIKWEVFPLKTLI